MFTINVHIPLSMMDLVLFSINLFFTRPTYMLLSLHNPQFNITHSENKDEKYLYALEDSHCLCRVIPAFKPIRPFQINAYWPGAIAPTDPKFAVYDRPLRCSVGFCKCCCYQEITSTADGKIIGSTIETMQACVPKLAVKDAQGDIKYLLHMPTCCGGMCIDVCAGGCCSCKIPFYLYDPAQDEPGKHVGEITKVFGGLKKELFTDADTFKIIYPPNIDGAMKANLLGSTFLINQLFFEGQQ